jgi:hypothetical protein
MTKLVACPVCNRQVSSQAVSCPNCGHPLAASSAPPPKAASASRADTWGDINRVGAVVSATIVTLTLGAQAAFVNFVGGPGGDGGAGTLAQVFVRTAPLTIAVMIIALAAMKEWFESFGIWVFFSGVILLVSTWLGAWLGGLSRLPSGGNIFSLIAFYLGYYGPAHFLSSLILGVFLAWVVTKFWPRKAAVTTVNTGSGK